MSKQIVLPAEVYDTLELSALAFDGIGGGLLFNRGSPHCAIGHLIYAGVMEAPDGFYGHRSFYGITANENDAAVEAINRRLGHALWGPVSFEEWCQRLNVVRGA